MFSKLVFFIFIFCLIYIYLNYENVKYYNWNIQLNNIKFPKKFKFGVATSSYQIEGYNFYNQWYEWELKTGIINGNSIEHRIRYKDDIKLMKNLKLNAYRFSIEWSRIEKAKGKYDYVELKYYDDLIDRCIENKIDLMITIFHWTIPKWFADIGGFEKEHNCKYFINFAKFIYTRYYKKIKRWCITNELVNYCNASYNIGIFPPNKKDIGLCFIVYWNFLNSQVKIYHKLKKIYPLNEIGFAKQFSIFRPYSKYNIIEIYLAKKIDHLFNNVELEFYKTGLFEINFGFIKINKKNILAINSFDFIGVNYYSHNYIKFDIFSNNKVDLCMNPNEIPTDFIHTIYPEGIIDVIKNISQFNKKIYITENGLADKKDKNRGLYIKKILYLISTLIQQGYKIKGYYHWTLIDNFEWNEGFEPKFGLYKVDNQKNRIMRKSAKVYKKIINNQFI